MPLVVVHMCEPTPRQTETVRYLYGTCVHVLRLHRDSTDRTASQCADKTEDSGNHRERVISVPVWTVCGRWRWRASRNLLSDSPCIHAHPPDMPRRQLRSDAHTRTHACSVITTRCSQPHFGQSPSVLLVAISKKMPLPSMPWLVGSSQRNGWRPKTYRVVSSGVESR